MNFLHNTFLYRFPQENVTYYFVLCILKIFPYKNNFLYITRFPRENVTDYFILYITTCFPQENVVFLFVSGGNYLYTALGFCLRKNFSFMKFQGKLRCVGLLHSRKKQKNIDNNLQKHAVNGVEDGNKIKTRNYKAIFHRKN